MKINWRVRLANPAFWSAFIPALALVVTSVLKVFGIELELNDLVQKISAVITAVFSLLALFGVVNDPTTAGPDDSNRAMTYDKPWVDPITLDDAA